MVVGKISWELTNVLHFYLFLHSSVYVSCHVLTFFLPISLSAGPMLLKRLMELSMAFPPTASYAQLKCLTAMGMDHGQVSSPE